MCGWANGVNRLRPCEIEKEQGYSSFAFVWFHVVV